MRCLEEVAPKMRAACLSGSRRAFHITPYHVVEGSLGCFGSLSRSILKNKLQWRCQRAVATKFQGKSDEAGRMCQRAVAIHEKLYGRNHPGAASYLNNWAMALKAQVRDSADSRDAASSRRGQRAASDVPPKRERNKQVSAEVGYLNGFFVGPLHVVPHRS